jgi:hypothetical protein
MTPAAAPTPIPAFAPVDMPLVVLSGSAAADELVDGGDVEADAGVDDGSDDLVDEVAAEPNIEAMVYRGALPSPEQHSELAPQHHVVELSLPLHGVTTMSRDA